MALLGVHRICKSFGARPLFSELTFAIEPGERIGLIGPNGAGKSTLLRILASHASPDAGTVSFQRGLRVGHLEQVPLFAEGATILSTVLEGSLSAGSQPDWESISAAGEYISKLELDRFEGGPEAPIAALSGGWKKRAALARELMRKPDLLLLDEPTNHLDVESILWLEKFLARAPFAALTVTHDRLFLQRVSNRIIELDPRHPGGLLSVQGDYARYLEVREQMISAQERREVVLRNTLRRETEWLRQGAKARTTKQQARIQRAEELQGEVQELSARNLVREARIDFQGGEKNPKKLVEAKSLGKSYGARRLFSGVDLLLGPGARIGLLGPNGSGKSTLIRVLLGHEEPSEGSVTRSEFLSVAYFDQTREALDPGITVLKTLCPSGEYVDYRGARVHVRGYLDRFLFSPSQMEMKVGKLSGGEQSRLLIARLMLVQANLLVLDEPTNDLDMATLGVLEECLTEFPGAVILVTHDRYFLDQVANRILAFPAGGGPLVAFANLSQWEDWQALQEKAARKAESGNERAEPQAAATPARKRKLGFKEQRELDSMEPDIHAAETKLVQLTEACSLPENSGNASKLREISAEMEATQREIDRLYKRWAELEAML